MNLLLYGLIILDLGARAYGQGSVKLLLNPLADFLGRQIGINIDEELEQICISNGIFC